MGFTVANVRDVMVEGEGPFAAAQGDMENTAMQGNICMVNCFSE
jgi:hypothetical protein